MNTYSARSLSGAAKILSKMHATILQYSPGINLCMELSLLLQFLTLPEKLVRSLQAGEAKKPLIWCTEVAVAYACAVLLEAGKRLSGVLVT